MQLIKETYGAPCTVFCTLWSLYIVCLFVCYRRTMSQSLVQFSRKWVSSDTYWSDVTVKCFMQTEPNRTL